MSDWILMTDVGYHKGLLKPSTISYIGGKQFDVISKMVHAQVLFG